MFSKRPGTAMGLVVVLGTLVFPRPALSEGSSGLSRGQTLRVTPVDRIEIPDVITVRGGRIESKGPFDREDGGRLLAVRIGPKALHVPMPGTTVLGTLVAVDDKTITMLRQNDAREITVPKAAIAKLEVGRGGSRHQGLAVAAGVVVGTVLGALVAWEGGAKNEWGGPVVAGLGGIVFGAAGGAIAGVATSPHWEPVSPARWHLAVAPRRDGAVAMATVRF